MKLVATAETTGSIHSQKMSKHKIQDEKAEKNTLLSHQFFQTTASTTAQIICHQRMKKKATVLEE